MIRFFKMCFFMIMTIIIIGPEQSSCQRHKEVTEIFNVKSSEILEVNILGDFAELYVLKGKKDREGTAHVTYNPETFSFDFFYDEEYNEVYIALDKDKLFKDAHIESRDAEMEVFLPATTPLNLDVEIKAGVIDLELSDLYIENFELNSWAGETTVSFKKPNNAIMKYMKVDVNIGEVVIENLGNANFEDAFIDGGIGSLVVDLSGEYSEGEHNLKVDLDIGSAKIELPENVGIRLSVSKMPLLGHFNINNNLTKKGKYFYSKNFDESKAKLLLFIEMGIGDCTIR